MTLIRQTIAITCAAGMLVAMNFASTVSAVADDWPEFRGPTGQGTTEAQLPLEWSESKNVRWKVPVEGLAWSSPVVSGNQIFLTTAVDKRVDDEPIVSLQLWCLNLSDGQQAWTKELFSHPGQRKVEIHSKNSHASPTPIVSGDKIYCHFGPHGTACVSASGELVWKNESIEYRPTHGNGGSPALYQDRLIICCDGSDRQFVLALDMETGKQLWRTERDTDVSRGFSFCTPTIIEVAGKVQAICPGSGAVFAYDPADGSEIWRVTYGEGYSVVPRPLFADGLVFVCSGYDDESIYAIDPRGEGDLTDSNVVWSANRNAPHSPSLTYGNGLLFSVSDRGIATCFDAKTGDVKWVQRMGGKFSASPLLAGDRIYFQDESGKTTVVAASAEYRELASNEIGSGSERTYASFAIADGSILLRSESFLYRIGE